MELERKVKLLQAFYAGALADSVLRYGNEGVLEKVTEQKRKEQMQTGKLRAAQLGIETPGETLERISEIFDCAKWDVRKKESGFTAETTVCILCAIAKKLGAQSPCRIYCLDGSEAIIKGLDPAASFEVKETLWEGSKCRIEVTGGS